MKLLSITSLSVILTLGQCAEPGQLSSVDLFRRASEQLALGNDILALNDFRKSLIADPNFVPAQYNLAATYLRLGRINQTLEFSQNCSDPRCNNIRDQALKYLDLLSEQPNEDDCQLFNSMLAISPKSVEALKLRAQCYFANNKVIEALADLTQVVQIDRSDSQSAARAAVGSFVLLDQRAQAMQMLRRCVSYDDEATVCKTANKQLRKLQKTVDTPVLKIKVASLIKEIRSLLKTYGIPRDGDSEGALIDNIRLERCHQLALRREYNHAAKVCAQVRDFAPDFPPALLVQAHLESEQGNIHQATEILNTIVREHSDSDVVKLAQELYAEIMAQRQRPQRQVPPDKDLYKILGVDSKADKKEIRRAYRQLSKKYHPDKYKGQDMTEEEVMEKMQEINEAYETLSNDDKRRDYDDQHSGGGFGSGFNGDFGDFGGFGGFGGFPFGGGGFHNVRFHEG